MTQARDRRPKSEPMSAEAAADLDARYADLQALLDRYARRVKARARANGDGAGRDRGEGSP